MSDIHQEKVLVLDFGSQTTQLIARRFRELGVKTVIERGDLGGEEIRDAAPIAIVLSGGPASVFEEGALQANPAVFDLGVPVLGICYGLHLMARDLGGKVIACEMTMEVMGIREDDLDKDFVDECGAVGTYLREAMDSDINLFI